MAQKKGEYIDIDTASQALSLDVPTVVELIWDFVETEDEFLAPLRQNLVAADFGHLKKNAHKLKGTAYNLRVDLIGEQAEDLEKYAASKDLSSCREQVSVLEESFEGIQNELESLEESGD